jgi:hypothetical protein
MMINKFTLINLANRIVAEPGLGHSSMVINPWESEARYPRFLRQLMKELDLKVAVECGVYLGISTEYMILSSDDSFVIGIDWELRLENIGPIYDRHTKNVIFLNHDTTDAGNKVCELLEGRTIDLLFLDSTHDGVTPKKEFEQYKPMFSDTTVVVCDDIGDTLMQDFWTWLPGEKVELNNLHLSYGASVGFGASIVKK